MPSKTLAFAFWLTILGGLAIAISALAPVPLAVFVVAAVAFLTGSTLVLVQATRDARRRSIPTARAAWEGLVEAARWVLAFLP